MVKVLVINGSPRMGRGNTALVLDAFVDGMVAAGADVDVVMLSELDIRPCAGEFACWYRTVGRCHIRDDMQPLYARLREADVWVLGTPVHLPLPGTVQNLLNRLMPLVEPVLETREGRTRARLHGDVRARKFVLVASSGWWELDNFGTVIHIATEMCKDIGLDLSGALLRPHAYKMRSGDGLTEDGKEVLRAARRAGRQLVEWGYMGTEALEAVRRPLVDQETCRVEQNEDYAKAVAARGGTEPSRKGATSPRARSRPGAKGRGRPHRKARRK